MYLFFVHGCHSCVDVRCAWMSVLYGCPFCMGVCMAWRCYLFLGLVVVYIKNINMSSLWGRKKILADFMKEIQS